jgi:hypothetical protein
MISEAYGQPAEQEPRAFQECSRAGTNATSFPADSRANRTLSARLVFAEELFPVFDEADQHHDCRPDHPEKEHCFQQPNCGNSKDHVEDSSANLAQLRMLAVGPFEIYFRRGLKPQIIFLGLCTG